MEKELPYNNLIELALDNEQRGRKQKVDYRHDSSYIRANSSESRISSKFTPRVGEEFGDVSEW